MELSSTTGTGTVNLPNLNETNYGNKADCYFYYYSSCTKGNTCPYRHEPAALRNETMCLYWLKGSCNKPHCIYRHMEITKKRDTIPCFFESQPGGCKKLHCPFFHNSLDRPTDEDVPKNLGLILPVKDSEADYETEESEMKKIQDCVSTQLKIQRKLSQSQTTNEVEDSPDSPLPCVIRRSFIVPLEDGESDSEEGSISPKHKTLSGTKRHWVHPEPEKDWELERLKEIQKQEGDILGYSFSSGFEDEMPVSEAHSYSCDENIDEMNCEEHDDYSNQTIIKKNFPFSGETSQESYLKKVLRGATKEKSRTESNTSSAFRENDRKGDVANNQFAKNEHDQMWMKRNGNISVKERLGRRKIRAQNDVENEPERSSCAPRVDESIKSRLGLRGERIERVDGLRREDSLGRQDRNVDFVIKSLSDIKAEKERQNLGFRLTTVQEPPDALPLSALINRKKEIAEDAVDVNSIKIKTLAEIKAERERKSFLKTAEVLSPNTTEPMKRGFSPIRFDLNSNKKVKPQVNNVRTVSNVVTREPLGCFSPRKLTIKKINSHLNSSEHSRLSKPKLLVGNAEATPAGRESAKISKSTSVQIKSSFVINSNNKSSSADRNSKTLSVESDGRKLSDLNIESNKKETNLDVEISGKDVSRLDSFLDEDELLLETDTTDIFEDEDINEDELLL